MKNAMTKREAAFSLIEMMIVVAIIAAIVAIAIPLFSGQVANQNLKTMSRNLANALNRARAEAVRTGDVHIVFVATDASGNTLQDHAGNDVAVVVLNDGAMGSAGQNCQIDGGEGFWTIADQNSVGLGVATATGNAPNDMGSGNVASGSTFTDPANNPATWVLFRPDGMPLAFDAACGLGSAGSGAGSFYLNNGDNTYAIVLKPLGGARIHGFNEDAATWTN